MFLIRCSFFRFSPHRPLKISSNSSPPLIPSSFVKKHLITTTFNRTKTMNDEQLTSNPNNKIKIAVIQLTSKQNKNENYEIAQRLIKLASDDGARMAFLPECFDMVCPSKKITMENGEPIDGPTVQKYQNLAKQLKMWLSLGGLHEKDASSQDRRLFNAHLVIDDDGQVVSIYRKVHLFNLDIPGTRLVESEFSQPGAAVIKPPVTPAGRIGMGICYDVRFPEFAVSLAKAGADVLTYPSSFTVPTGKAHWETLLKCRAIETQCYVVAAAQVGAHNEKRSSYGHSMIVDPWGKVLAEVTEEQPAYATAMIDFDYLKQVRQRLPVWTDRRPELYGFIMPAQIETNSSTTKFEENFQFGPTAIVKPCQIFVRTQHSIGFINHRPVLPGHVLVSPMRTDCKRLSDLNNGELFDLFLLVQKVQKAVENIHGADSSTVAIQDGKDAGQSIEHLHVHIVPRKSTDFGGEVDKIYEKLEKHDKKENVLSLRLLTEDEMLQQCQLLRKYNF